MNWLAYSHIALLALFLSCLALKRTLVLAVATLLRTECSVGTPSASPTNTDESAFLAKP